MYVVLCVAVTKLNETRRKHHFTNDFAIEKTDFAVCVENGERERDERER